APPGHGVRRARQPDAGWQGERVRGGGEPVRQRLRRGPHAGAHHRAAARSACGRAHRAAMTLDCAGFMFRLSAFAFLLAILNGCGPTAERTPMAPTAPTPAPTPPTPPGPPTATALAGMVFETTTEGTRPLPGAQVIYAVGDAWAEVRSDVDGRFAVPMLRDRVPERVIAFGPLGTSLEQRTASIPPRNAGGTLNIELVAPGTSGRSFGSPALSGSVYYLSAAGRQPW